MTYRYILVSGLSIYKRDDFKNAILLFLLRVIHEWSGCHFLAKSDNLVNFSVSFLFHL